MVKAKTTATTMVSDGAGGLVPVQDRRFESEADWPIRFEVAKENSDLWFRYFYSECERRGWSCSCIGQLEARENSGSITVNTGSSGTPQLAVVWDWKREGKIKVRAKSAGPVEFTVLEANAFFDQVNERCLSRATERFYARHQLLYDGLAWRGELWLDDTVRLGAPTNQYENALYGPRVIMVDMVLDCAGRADLPRAVMEKVGWLSSFLSVVMGTQVELPKMFQSWTCETGLADCKVRSHGYLEPNNPQEMPARGTTQATPFKIITRPDFSLRGIDGSTSEISVPSDITDLWAAFCKMNAEKRRSFLQAAAKWREALMHSSEARTLSFALLVVACEALKPAGKKNREHNVYDVVEALLGASVADRLQADSDHAQSIRNVHLHRGEFRASEFVHEMMMSCYHDPTFEQAHRYLTRITQESIIEWLRRGGAFALAAINQKKSWRRWMKDRIYVTLLIAGALAFALGWIACFVTQ